jgi:hypothetical protein
LDLLEDFVDLIVGSRASVGILEDFLIDIPVFILESSQAALPRAQIVMTI